MAVIAAAGIGAAATIFASSSSSSASKAQAQAQKEAAELQTRVARELHEHWKAYYRDCDIRNISEICATPVYVPQYDTVMGRSRLQVLGSFGRARQQMLRSCDIFCVGKVAQDCNFMAGIEAQALADAMNFGYRREENLKIQLDQMRLDNIHRALALGRNLLDQSRAASSIAAGVGARVGAQSGNAANGWLQFAGFLNTPEGKRLLGEVSLGVRGLAGSGSMTGQTPAEIAASNARDYAYDDISTPAANPGGLDGSGGDIPYDSANAQFPASNFQPQDAGGTFDTGLGVSGP